MNVPAEKVPETVQVLIDILRDVPFIDFPECLSWSGMLDGQLILL